MSKSQRIKNTAAEYVPVSRTEADEAVRIIGEQQRKRDALQTEMNTRLADLKAEFESKAQPIGESIKALSHGVQVWAEANRAELTQQGRTKTVRLGHGEISWRMRPAAVAIRGSDAVLAALKRLGLGRFIRTKEEIDKDAIRKDADAVAGVKGISITQGEDFAIVPFSTKLEEVAP